MLFRLVCRPYLVHRWSMEIGGTKKLSGYFSEKLLRDLVVSQKTFKGKLSFKIWNGPNHKFIKKWDGKRELSMSWAINHPFFD